MDTQEAENGNICLIFLAKDDILCYNDVRKLQEGASDMPSKKPRGETQERVLAYIQSEIRRRGYAPSVREIADAVGLRSTSTVHGHLMRLEKKGLLYRDAMKPRAIGIAAPPEDEAMTERIREVPVVGQVAAGIPITAEENIEELLPLPASLLGTGEHFVLRVKGESMIGAGILNGDYIVVRSQPDAQNGEIVVAMIDGEATVKRFYKENGYFRLQPENDAMLPIITSEVKVLGKVVSVLRKL